MSQTRTQTYTEITLAIPRILSTAPVRTGIASERHEVAMSAAANHTRRASAHWPPATLGDPRQVKSACWHRNSCRTCPGRASCRTLGL